MRAYDRYKAERPSLIYTCFLVVLIEFADFKVKGGHYLGLQGTISWDAISTWIIPILLDFNFNSLLYKYYITN